MAIQFDISKDLSRKLTTNNDVLCTKGISRKTEVRETSSQEV